MPSAAQARDWALRAIVLLNADLAVQDDGVVFPGTGLRVVPWRALADDLPDAASPAEVGAGAVRRWSGACRWVTGQPQDMIRDLVRVFAAPAGHPFAPSGLWAVEQVHGGSLSLGFGAAGIDPAEPDTVLPVPACAWALCGIDPARRWPRVRLLHERMGEGAALLHAAGSGHRQLRPMGGHDVVTLLGSRTYRRYLADRGDHGMATVLVPVREQGWLSTGLVDAAFAEVTAGTADDERVGFARPVLVTRDEIVQVQAGGEHAPLLDRRGPTLSTLSPLGRPSLSGS